MPVTESAVLEQRNRSNMQDSGLPGPGLPTPDLKQGKVELSEFVVNRMSFVIYCVV